MSDEGVEFRGDAVQRAAKAEFVEVMFAKSSAEASSCCSLLESHNIPARIALEGGDIRDTGVPILVPTDTLDDAAELLAMRAQDDDEEDVDGLGDLESEDDEDDDDFDDDDDDEDDDEFMDDDEI